MLSLIKSPNGHNFRNIYIYSKSLHQPKYIYLKRLIDPIKGIYLYTFSENVDVFKPTEAKVDSIFIFDDVIQGTIQKFQPNCYPSIVYSSVLSYKIK